jgi:hypothetical protein
MGESTRLIVLLLLSLIPLIYAVDMGKFRACRDTDFCKRNRELEPAPSVYNVVAGTVKATDDKITADILNTFNNAEYVLEITTLPNRILRLKIDEKSPIKPRYHFIRGEVIYFTLYLI